MSEISDRYRRLSHAFADKVAQVPDDKWAAPSPCEDWTARDVVEHVARTPVMFFEMIGKEKPELPEDAVAALTVSREAIQSALDDPEIATTEFDGFFGRSTFEAAVDRFLNFDLVVHNWDLSRAAGLDERLDEDDIARLEEASTQFGDSLRAPGVFGAELTPPDGADRQTKLLAFLGRKAF